MLGECFSTRQESHIYRCLRKNPAEQNRASVILAGVPGPSSRTSRLITFGMRADEFRVRAHTVGEVWWTNSQVSASLRGARVWKLNAQYATAFLQGLPVLFLKQPLKRIFYSLCSSSQGVRKSSNEALFSVLFVHFVFLNWLQCCRLKYELWFCAQ